MSTETLICVPLFQEDLNKCQKIADKALKIGADILELRIDGLQKPDTDKIINFIQNLDSKLIVTNRTASEGGLFEGSEIERTDILREVAGIADYVDIELNTEENLLLPVLKAAKSSIVSYHDFNKTPDVTELIKIVNMEKKLGDIAKFAVTPQNMGDTLKVLEVLARVEDTIGISMGELGSYTRVVSALFGSPITFSSIDGGSAPGQLDLKLTKLFLDKFNRR